MVSGGRTLREDMSERKAASHLAAREREMEGEVREWPCLGLDRWIGKVEKGRWGGERKAGEKRERDHRKELEQVSH
jgi:hypothetical protein